MDDLNMIQTQTDPALHPNQQDPATLLAPESAPEHHKTYFDRDRPDPDAPPPVTGLYPTQADGENAGDKLPDGSGSDRWGASDWTQAGYDASGFPVEKGSPTDVSEWDKTNGTNAL